MIEKLNFFKRTEKKVENNPILESKYLFIKENNITSFEDWSQKTFQEKLSILLKLDAIPYNFNHFEKDYDDKLQEKINNDFDKNNLETSLELDKSFDFFMRIIKYPGYVEQSKILYTEESKNLADNEEDLEYKKYYQYSEHKYPEELLDIKPDVLEAYRKERELEDSNQNKNDYIFSPLEALKNNGIKDLSEWYSKSIDEKRKILMSSGEFMGVDVEVKKGKIPLTLQYGKEEYNKYLDQCFYSSMYRISEVSYLKNQWINEILNKDELLDKARQNLENQMELKFKQKSEEFEKL